jgi:glycosyl transferase, family 25
MIPIRVISLDRTPERRRRFAAQNPGLPYEWFAAVDGWKLETTLPGYTQGATGCALSHITLWQDCVESDEILTIVEDDAVLRPDFATLTTEILRWARCDWDIVVWGWNMDSVLVADILPRVHMVASFDQLAAREHIDEFRKDRSDPMLSPLLRCFGTPCYTVSPHGADRLLNGGFLGSGDMVYFPGLNRSLAENGIDIAMNRAYSVLKAFVAIPPLAVTPNDNAESTTLPGSDRAIA